MSISRKEYDKKNRAVSPLFLLSVVQDREAATKLAESGSEETGQYVYSAQVRAFLDVHKESAKGVTLIKLAGVTGDFFISAPFAAVRKLFEGRGYMFYDPLDLYRIYDHPVHEQPVCNSGLLQDTGHAVADMTLPHVSPFFMVAVFNNIDGAKIHARGRANIANHYVAGHHLKSLKDEFCDKSSGVTRVDFGIEGVHPYFVTIPIKKVEEIYKAHGVDIVTPKNILSAAEAPQDLRLSFR